MPKANIRSTKATSKSTSSSTKNKSQKKQVKSEPQVQLRSSRGIETEFHWSAPERVWKPKTQVWYLSYAAVFLFFILIAAKLGYPILIVALLALMLLWFVQGSMQPWTIEHTITSRGLYSFGEFHRWENYRYFWLAIKSDSVVLHLDPWPNRDELRLTIVLPPGEELMVFDILIQKILYAEPGEIGYNFVSKYLTGEYVPVSDLLEDLDQPIISSPQKKQDPITLD